MRRRSRSYSPPPQRRREGREYGERSSRRSRSPSRGRYGGRGDPPTSLLVRNIPRDCLRSDDLRLAFERYGVVKDVYLPKDYYTGEPRGFGFVQYTDPGDAAEAQYHMDHQIINGREITVVFATENRKKPQEMRSKERTRGRTEYGRSFSRSPRHSRSPRRERVSRQSRPYSPERAERARDRSNSPAPRSSQHRVRKYTHSPSPPSRKGPAHTDTPSRRSSSPPHFKDAVHPS